MNEVRLGFILPIYLYKQERVAWAERALASLRKTEPLDYRPALLCVVKPSNHSMLFEFPQFEQIIITQPPEVRELNSAFAYGYTEIFARFPWITHACILCDDWVYHPTWLGQLQNLILRHPDAKGWSVYRSGNARWHRTLREEGEDCLVTSLNGPGAISREGWRAWGVNYASFPDPSGYSIDLLHVVQCRGERWATRKSYIQHIGVRGTYAHAGELDLSEMFVGE